MDYKYFWEKMLLNKKSTTQTLLFFFWGGGGQNMIESLHYNYLIISNIIIQ